MMGSGTLLKVCELVFRDDWGCLFNHRAVLGQSEERLEAKRPWGGYDSVLIMRSGTKKDGALAGWLSWSVLPSTRRLWVWFPLGHREEGCRWMSLALQKQKIQEPRYGVYSPAPTG